MEYFPLGDLRKLISAAKEPASASSTNETGIDFRLFLGISADVCEGMVYLHKRHILHLDLKPENIMVVSTNVCDFS
jgi:serine/threonine protein kinase